MKSTEVRRQKVLSDLVKLFGNPRMTATMLVMLAVIAAFLMGSIDVGTLLTVLKELGAGL